MNPLLYTARGSSARLSSLLALSEWQEKEKYALNCAVDEEGCLLDNLTLELRVHPPEINIDNTSEEKSTVITIDSANRPGSLVFVVQHLTELGLRINSARISSDGGWFHDVFSVCEPNGEQVRNADKIHSIKQMLNVYLQDEEIIANGDDTDDMKRVETTVFELAGKDKPGLLADVTNLLMHNGCNVRSAAVWTYQGRVAFVLSVTEKGKPVENSLKLQRLRQLVLNIMDSDTGAHVSIHKVRGEIHHDRRLHQLMLREEKQDWERARQEQVEELKTAESDGDTSPTDSASSVHGQDPSISPFRSPKSSRPIVDISHCTSPDYWTVTIKCRDRTKLLFDTVCTLADMDYDIFHATIDSTADGNALQEYYIRPRTREGDFSPEQAALLKAMLESAIQRRFPKGLKVHVRSLDRFGCLALLAQVLREANLSVTRAKVRTFATSKSSGHTLYVMAAQGGPPDKIKVQEACQKIGGKLVEGSSSAEQGKGSGSVDLSGYHFSFSFLTRQWHSNWGGSPGSNGVPLGESPGGSSSNGSL